MHPGGKHSAWMSLSYHNMNGSMRKKTSFYLLVCQNEDMMRRVDIERIESTIIVIFSRGKYVVWKEWDGRENVHAKAQAGKPDQ